MRAPPTPPLGWPTSPSGNSSSCRSTTTGSGTATTGCSPRRWWPSCTDGNRRRSHGSTCGPPRGTSSREWSRRPSRTVSPAGSGTAARLVDEYGTEYIGIGRIATVRRWVQVLGQDTLLAYPPVAVTAAWTAALSGETERAHHLLPIAERASSPGPLPNGHASLDAATSLLRAMMGAQGVDQVLVDARHALDLEPPGSGGTRCRRRCWVSRSCCAVIRKATEQFEYVMQPGRKPGSRPAAVLARRSATTSGSPQPRSPGSRHRRRWQRPRDRAAARLSSPP